MKKIIDRCYVTGTAIEKPAGTPMQCCALIAGESLEKRKVSASGYSIIR
ncbi:MAG: hypothetical protein LBK18_07400 [Prevotellaceae bacterium]|nr:hypothetical protein [Prevotellaceae bacterium]